MLDPPFAPSVLVTAGESLLALVVRYLKQLGVAIPVDGSGADVAFVSPGTTAAWDGEQLTVNFAGLFDGAPGMADSRPVWPQQLQQYAEWNVTLLRSVSTVADGQAATVLPSPADMAADSRLLLTDAIALRNVAVLIRSEGELVDVPLPMTVGPVVPVGPDGALAGNRLSVASPLI